LDKIAEEKEQARLEKIMGEKALKKAEKAAKKGASKKK
jgi:hypothetical protein